MVQARGGADSAASDWPCATTKKCNPDYYGALQNAAKSKYPLNTAKVNREAKP